MMKYIVLIGWFVILISGQWLDTYHFISAMQLHIFYTIFMLAYYNSIFKDMQGIYNCLLIYYSIVFLTDYFISDIIYQYVVFESFIFTMLIAVQFDKDNLKCNTKDI